MLQSGVNTSPPTAPDKHNQMLAAIPISVSNWPAPDNNAYWTTQWTAIAAIAACFAAVTALVLPVLLPWLLDKFYPPKLVLIVPSELPDPDKLDINGKHRRITAFLHLVVKNTGALVQNASVNLVGIVDSNMKPRDINFKRNFPWSFGQISNDLFVFKASFKGTLAIDFLHWGIMQDSSESPPFCASTLDFALLQHRLTSSKFAIRAGNPTYCVLELTGDNYKTTDRDLYVISVTNSFDPGADIFKLPLNLFTISNGLGETSGIGPFTKIAVVTDQELRRKIIVLTSTTLD